MKITTVEYKVIRVSDPVGSGDVIAKTSPNSVDEMIIQNDLRLLEIDVIDRIAYCLMGSEFIGFRSETSTRTGKFSFDRSLSEGCSLLGWSLYTVVDIQYHLMPDTIYQAIETVDKWNRDKQVKPLNYVIITKDSVKGRKRKDGGVRVNKNVIIYNDRDFFQFADRVITDREKLLTDRELRELKRTKNEYLEKLHNDNQSLIAKAQSAYSKGRVALFLGAGVSIDAGLPNWSQLLQGVFESKNMKPYAYLSERNTDAILDTYGNSNIIAGRYAFNGFKDEDIFRSRIKEVLYQAKKPSSELVNAICAAIIADNEKKISNIVTYNFDDLIETRLDELNYKNYNSVYGKNRETSKYLQIYHVHGMIPQRKGIESTPILSEKDYHNLYRNSHNWANVVQLYSMNTMTCFFIGLSLTDPNLRRLLDFSYSDEGPSMVDKSRCPHYAFLQRKELKGDKRVRVNQEHWKVQEQMLREFGINVIWYDEHNELPELIKEIMLPKVLDL